MLFNSLSFAVFFPAVVIIYYFLSAKYRNIFLLIASCAFYMAFVPKYILILLSLITADYFLAQEIDKRDGPSRKFLLLISIAANLGTLIFFRYFNFLSQNISELAQLLHWNYAPTLLRIALPLGLSFHVFQSIAYVVEVYRKKFVPERNYIVYALYVMFFPQLVAGPIERPQHLLPQLHNEQVFDPLIARRGLERMLWGFFKKLVIADQIAQIINPLYAHLPSSGILLLIMAGLFAYQLYCDFSGYSDIALGAAMMFGIQLTENFDRPFSAQSFAEFWRKWHISLSSWLRDYLYFPLAFSWGKSSRFRLHACLFISFVLIGLWHGPNWTYVVFGALNGGYIVIETITEKFRRRLFGTFVSSSAKVILGAISTFFVFWGIALSLVFFRSDTLGTAWVFLSQVFSSPSDGISLHQLIGNLVSHTGKVVFLVTLASIILLEVVQYYQEKFSSFFIFEKFPRAMRYGWYYFLVGVILFFGYFGAQTFIYFQF